VKIPASESEKRARKVDWHEILVLCSFHNENPSFPFPFSFIPEINNEMNQLW
jgi:hypothetical protein